MKGSYKGILMVLLVMPVLLWGCGKKEATKHDEAMPVTIGKVTVNGSYLYPPTGGELGSKGVGCAKEKAEAEGSITGIFFRRGIGLKRVRS